MSEGWELPRGWTIASLADLATAPSDIGYGVLQPGGHQDDGVPMLRVKDIKGNDVDTSGVYRISRALDEQYRRTRLVGGELLVSIQGTVGRVALVPDELAGSNISRTLAKIPLRDRTLGPWLHRVLQSPQMQNRLAEQIGGTTRDSLNLGALRAIEVPLPPVREQRRIVAKLDALLASSRAARAALSEAREMARRGWRALLTAAIRGDLTRSWRSDSSMGSDELPAGWRWARLPEMAELRDNLRVPLNAAERSARPGPYPYYGANGQAGWLDDFRYDGDHVLIAEDGGFFGQPDRHVAYAVTGRFWVNNHAHVLRARPPVTTELLCHWLNAFDWMPYVSGTTRLKLTQGRMNDARFPLPPHDEQMEICRLLRQGHESLAQLTEKTADCAAGTERLQAAILTRAFRGDLVPQDPSDEPASTVLARMRAERTALARTPRRRTVSRA